MNVVSLSVLCGLATWRLSSLLHTEDAFEWLREWIGIGHDSEGYPGVYPGTFWGRTFGCFWCLSLMTALPLAIGAALLAKLSLAWSPFMWLAASAIAIWLEKQIMRTQSR